MKNAKKRILLVDDEKIVTRLLKLSLEETDSYVVRVENIAAHAVAAAEQFEPDLILLDIMMPGLDGGDMAQLFHENRRLTNIPIVFLTAAATKLEVSAKAGRIGGLAFLAKPVEVPEVIRCIEKHMVK